MLIQNKERLAGYALLRGGGPPQRRYTATCTASWHIHGGHGDGPDIARAGVQCNGISTYGRVTSFVNQPSLCTWQLGRRAYGIGRCWNVARELGRRAGTTGWLATLYGMRTVSRGLSAHDGLLDTFIEALLPSVQKFWTSVLLGRAKSSPN